MYEYRIVLDDTDDYQGGQIGGNYHSLSRLALDLPAATQDRPYHIEVRDVATWELLG